MDSNVRWLFFLLVLLAPVCTAGEAAAMATAALLTPTTINTSATINTWTSLNSSIEDAAGKTTVFTLSTSFSGYTAGIIIDTAYTKVTIVGNGATFDAKGTPSYNNYFFFKVGEKATLAMSNVTLQNGHVNERYASYGGAVWVAAGGTFTVASSTFAGNSVEWDPQGGQGGAVYVAAGGTFTVNSTLFSGNTVADEDGEGGAVYVAAGGTCTVTSSTFSGNTADPSLDGDGGAVYVAAGGTFAVTSTTFSGNAAGDPKYSGGRGGALFFDGGTGLIKNCTFVGPISDSKNDIYNIGGNVTFSCADDEVGSPVQMQGTEITVIPPKELKCTAQTYACYNGGKANWKCVPDPTSTATLAQCHEVCAP
jgi:hypothetical protein